MMLTTPHAPVLTGEDFEALYAAAEGNAALIPWARECPHPALVTWLNAVAPSLIRCGARVGVVGCGLGHDARELRRRGYDVTAFDRSETAIGWARRIDPTHAECFHVADLFDAPARWRRRFDLVVEINTVQALAPARREQTLQAISELLSPHGYLLVICRGTETPVEVESGPPWPLTEDELRRAAAAAGLVEHTTVSTFLDREVPPVRRMRAVFRRSAV